MFHSLGKQPLAVLAVCLLLFTQALAVLDALTLRLQYDDSAKAQQRYVYTTRIPMAAAQTADVYTNEQLVHIAHQAFDFMQQDAAVGKRKRPGAITVLAPAKGDSIYVISSLKNGAFLYVPGNAHPKVELALARCSAQNNGDPHRLGAACGEPLCAQAFFKDHPDLAEADLVGARVVTWGARTDGNGIMAPCGTPDAWGCSTFVQDLQFVPIPTDTVENPNTILPIGEHPVRPCIL